MNKGANSSYVVKTGDSYAYDEETCIYQIRPGEKDDYNKLFQSLKKHTLY